MRVIRWLSVCWTTTPLAVRSWLRLCEFCCRTLHKLHFCFPLFHEMLSNIVISPPPHRHYLLYLILGWYCSSWNASRFRGNARTIQNSRQKPTHFIQLGRRFCIIRIQLCRSTNIQGSKLWSWIRSAIRSDGMKTRFLKVARQTSALFDNWIELNWRYF